MKPGWVVTFPSGQASAIFCLLPLQWRLLLQRVSTPEPHSLSWSLSCLSPALSLPSPGGLCRPLLAQLLCSVDHDIEIDQKGNTDGHNRRWGLPWLPPPPPLLSSPSPLPHNTLPDRSPAISAHIIHSNYYCSSNSNMATSTSGTLLLMMILVLAVATATAASTSRGMPSWVMPEDRRLLLTASPPVDAVVAKDGSGDHATISGAVAAAPPGDTRYTIYIKEGVYQEKVELLHRNNVMLIGDGAARTVITGNESRRTVGTPCTATVSAQREGIIIRDLTIENTAGPEAEQAVALVSNSNKSVIYRCQILGFQDTLLAENFLQFYKECEIAGTVDFIWGTATAVFQDCVLLARRPGSMQHNAVTGQGRNKHDSASGFTFQGCNVTTREDLCGVETYLGRPWHPYARVIFIHCHMDAIVHPSGWAPWDKNKINVTTTRTVFFAEFENQGPGADVRGRVKWSGFHNIKKASKAAKFTVNNFIDGGAWLPETGVPYKGGL